jgi:uncharacterized RDD family membrane protein YckC
LTTARAHVGIGRAVETPEGVVLDFQLASIGERVLAFGMDGVILLAGMSLPLVLVALSGATRGGGWLVAFATVLAFVLRHFYFTWFELSQQGRTPGKRLAGIRVIDARGGQLRAEAVFVRNVTRDLELLAPLVILAAPALATTHALGFVRFLSLAWLLAFGIMPLLNRDRMRVGDLLAGTIVVRSPRVRLAVDLGAVTTQRREDRARPPRFRFAREQLDMYGIRELHVLADLLRRTDDGVDRDLALVSEQVMRKIGWDPAERDVDPRQFLRALYPALRAHLENKMVLGKRQEHKKAGRLRRE